MPSIRFLVEDEEWFVTELGELCAPAGSTFNGAVRQYVPNDIDFLAVIDLMPDGLKNFFECRCVGKRAIHQSAYIGKADVALLQLLMSQHANSSRPRIVMSLEREVHFFNAVTFGRGSKSRLRSIRCST